MILPPITDHIAARIGLHKIQACANSEETRCMELLDLTQERFIYIKSSEGGDTVLQSPLLRFIEAHSF